MSTQTKRPAYLLRVGRAHKRLWICVRARDILTAIATPAAPITRMLIGWDVGVLVFIVVGDCPDVAMRFGRIR